ncbi:NAD(P)-binding protein [Dichomitus squalens LYAD-421 SS1]|uniref:NAD(P)-binding protein n=1 Tax=Dichomitus squalens (strain LYAD-421) TaxID=732165 RepID=R7SGT2_DICSQ|nr:NAD(P)-binding protein [Dichomitus squalens LYAD-421 SS1]EJF55364.1 NAD(P)-binding protein [Dichomitus squalens LYAD-421 SS1]
MIPTGSRRLPSGLSFIHARDIRYRDIVVAKGTYPLPVKKNPVPGSDVAGEILAVGEEVKGWKVGERVSVNFSLDHIFGDANDETIASTLGAPIDGVLTEYKIFPAHALVRIPDFLSYEEASTLPCAAVTAYNGLFGGKPTLKGGDTVLIQGTGGVSIFGLQNAVASGATVIVTSSSDRKLEAAKKLGAKYLINYKTTPNWEEEVLKITNGRGVDHVLEVGSPGTVVKSAKAVRFGGNVALIGFVAGLADTNQLPLLVHGKGSNLHGVIIGSRQQFEDLIRLIEAVKLKPVVDKVFDFEHVREAYEYLESQQHVGKIVIKVSKDQ